LLTLKKPLLKTHHKKIKLIYSPGQLDDLIKEQIKQNKKGILDRIEENEAARRAGFLVYQHGMFYEYRYGFGAYLFIERLPNGLASVWRENYLPEKPTPIKTKVMAENVPFKKVFENAQGFISWLKKHNNKAG
jgi:hypothetical protein